MNKSSQRLAFEAEALRRWNEYLVSGKYYTAKDVREYCLARARSQKPAMPEPHETAPGVLARLRRKT